MAKKPYVTDEFPITNLLVDDETGELTPMEKAPPMIAVIPPFFKTPWNHDRDMASITTALFCKDPSKTQQQFAADADINNILRKFMNTGELPSTGAPRYMDVEKEFDLQDQMVTAYQVQEAWDALPAAVRNILKDPKTLSDYVSHCFERGDLDPLIELGLVEPPAAPPPAAPPAPTSTPTPPGEAPAPGPASGAS